MIKLSVDESGKRKPRFSYPDAPAHVPAGKCEKCGGNTRAEEFRNWTAAEGHTVKRIFRCIVHGHRCPTNTVTVGQESQKEETMAKTKSGGLICKQTLPWCLAMKAAITEKHLAYKDVAKDAAISNSSLAQGLNMHMSLSPETQARIEAAVAAADPVQSVKARNMAQMRKAKAKKTELQKAFDAELPASLQVSETMGKMADAMAKETQETILRNLEAQAEQEPDAVVTWSEEQPRPGLLQTEMLEVNPDNLEAALGLPTGTGRAEVTPETPPLEEVYAELVRVGCATPAEAGDMLDKEAEKQPLGSVERRLLASAGNYYDLVQRHKALECRVQDLAERAEERFTAFAQGHQLHEDRLGRMELSQVEAASDAEDQDIANAKRFQDLDDRLTESHNHLSEQIADQPAPVARAPFDGLDEWLEDNWWRRADRMVQELSVYTDSQLQALVTAATARRDLLKSLEAA